MLCFSPAKLNLFFSVLRKRRDGFHDIATVTTLIDLGDWLEIALSDEDRFHCSDKNVPAGKENLIWRAAQLFKEVGGFDFNLAIRLTKNIPMEAGLGGGSGNAATTLWMLNELLDRPFTEKKLIELAGQIGSDAPLFFSHGLSCGTGRGEKITPVPFFSFPHLWVAKPKELSLSTAQVYKHCKPRGEALFPLIEILTGYYRREPVFFNDLEEAAFSLKPELEGIQRRLVEIGLYDVTMTGSGTAFFALGEIEEPQLDGIDFYRVKMLRRAKGKWWETSKSFDVKNNPTLVTYTKYQK